MVRFAADFNAQKLLDVLADVFNRQHCAEYGLEIAYSAEPKGPLPAELRTSGTEKQR